MALPVEWLDAEESILVATIQKDTTWDEYHAAIDHMITEAARVKHRVDIIFHDNVGMPKGNPLHHLKVGSTKVIKQTNIQSTVIAGSRGSTGFVRSIMEILAKSMQMAQARQKTQTTAGNGLMFRPTLDSAVQFIRADRERSQKDASVK
ncbi:MAG TPA: hypothetical protein PLQ56_06805 [Aggregatilineales bacterium]|nr:hypothetical protein [Aggregatilineales bacterium]